jgi:uncharacterized protein (TIGR03118 family)
MTSLQRRLLRISLIVSCVAEIVACGGGGVSVGGNTGGVVIGGRSAPIGGANSGQGASSYTVSYLVSNGAALSAHVDANLVNPWGIAFAAGGPAWIVNNRSNTATRYDAKGVPILPTLRFPVGSNGNSNPTGIVVNVSSDFVINSVAGPAAFIFSGEGGSISAWSQGSAAGIVNLYDDRSGGAVYKGLTFATTGGVNLLYATDFRNNKIDVFDRNVSKTSVSGNFSDPSIPAGFAPHGIATASNRIYVTYAKQLTPGSREVVSGAGLGFVNTFEADGRLILRTVSAGVLNAPWGIAIAPSGFGLFSGALLIGNFGDGVINAFDPVTGRHLGSLRDARGDLIVIPGLWGISFGNGADSQPATTLYFTAGPNNEADGVYGSIAVTVN